MALPTTFSNPCDYFKEVILFLQKYSWIYATSNTTYIKNGILEQMSQTYKNYFMHIDNETLNHFPYVHDENFNHNPNHNNYVTMPKELKDFRQQLKRLISNDAYIETELSINQMNEKNVLLKGMNVKKQYEIKQLSQRIRQLLINKNDMKKDEYLLFEFGSGLGYLSKHLSELNRNYFILGLEADGKRVRTSMQHLQQLQTIYNKDSDTNAQAQRYCRTNTTATENATRKTLMKVIYKQHYINDVESQSFIETIIRDACKFNYMPYSCLQWQWAIIGLHACADLTITAMKLFYDIPRVRYLIIMPCCYHKMEMCTETLKFRNFPLSEALKQTFISLAQTYDQSNGQYQFKVDTDTQYRFDYHPNTIDYVKYLNRPFLRLACQRTIKSWCKLSVEQHMLHGTEMFDRALAEAIIDNEKEIVIKLKNTNHEMKYFTFDHFSKRYKLKDKFTKEDLLWQSIHKRKYEALIRKYSSDNENENAGVVGVKLSEGLVCLQASLQKLCENFVLYDRLCYMEEVAKKRQIKINVKYEKLLNDEISPRCYALIVRKI